MSDVYSISDCVRYVACQMPRSVKLSVGSRNHNTKGAGWVTYQWRGKFCTNLILTCGSRFRRLVHVCINRINKTQVASVKLKVFSFLQRYRVKCGGLGWEWVMFLSLTGLVSVCAKFQLPSLSKSGLKVPGGVVVVVVGWLRPILVFSLSLSQAKQFLDFK